MREVARARQRRRTSTSARRAGEATRGRIRRSPPAASRADGERPRRRRMSLETCRRSAASEPAGPAWAAGAAGPARRHGGVAFVASRRHARGERAPRRRRVRGERAPRRGRVCGERAPRRRPERPPGRPRRGGCNRHSVPRDMLSEKPPAGAGGARGPARRRQAGRGLAAPGSPRRRPRSLSAMSQVRIDCKRIGYICMIRRPRAFAARPALRGGRRIARRGRAAIRVNIHS